MSAQSKRDQRQKLKGQGLVSMECWVLPENKQALKGDEMRYREKIGGNLLAQWGNGMTLMNGLYDPVYEQFFGINDCKNCHPEHFINDEYQE